MAVHVVTWNLNKENAAYPAARATFFAKLAGFDYSYSASLNTTAFVSTNLAAYEVYQHLASGIDDNDRLFVAQFYAGGYMGFLDQAQVDWINARL